MGVYGDAVDREVADCLHDLEENAVQLLGPRLNGTNDEDGSSERELDHRLEARLGSSLQNLLGELVETDLRGENLVQRLERRLHLNVLRERVK